METVDRSDEDPRELELKIEQA